METVRFELTSAILQRYYNTNYTISPNLFLIFDIEIFMTMPYALTVYETGHYGFWIIMVFFGILTLGFVYEFNSKALYFSQVQPANEEELSSFPSIILSI